MISPSYKFASLDPRSSESSQAANDAVLGTEQDSDNTVLGIEVTVPALASRCTLGNIDPQHTQRLGSTAIDESLSLELPPPGTTLATIKPDLDSVGSMAVLDLRAQGGLNLSPEFAGDVIERIAGISAHDMRVNGPWSEKELPTRQAPWPTATEGNDPKTYSALAAAASDFKVPLEQRVETIKEFIVAGTVPSEYIVKVEKERTAMIDALEAGEVELNVQKVGDMDVAIVHSKHRFATEIGYTQAPVVIAVNDEFSFKGGPAHRKVTVCQHETGHVDMNTVKAELSSIEEGVGGSPTIIGSRQGEATALSVEHILHALSKGERIDSSA